MDRLCFGISINSSKGCEYMPTIAPVSDLRNYGSVLEQVSAGSSVYLTRFNKYKEEADKELQ